MENNEDIKIVEEMIKRLDKNCFDIYRKAKNTEDYLGTITGKEIIAIENLLSRLKTAERMNDVLADKVYIEEMDFNCSPMCVHDNCINECIKEWARKKVEEND